MPISTLILNLLDFIKAATILFKKGYIVPGLVLLYTGIDIVASLERRGDEGTKAAFVRWCSSYLDESLVPCTSVDLYSARCGILHGHTPDSDLTRAGKARKVYYAWGTGKAASLDEIAKHVKTSDAINIHVDGLRDAFLSGIKEWATDVQKDPTRTAKVEKRLSKWFTNLPKEIMDEVLKGILKETAK
jgi:hypothetical protein